MKEKLTTLQKAERNRQKQMENLIPPGPYCYVIDIRKQDARIPGDGVPIVCCPHKKTREFNGTSIPWCVYLEQGGLRNDHTEEEFEKLVHHFGTDDAVFDFLPLDLLWDGCKECGENKFYGLNEEKILNWITKVEDHEATESKAEM